MGKPPTIKSAKKSVHQVNIMTSFSSSHLMDKKKRHNKTKNKIKTLFNKLKRQSRIFSTATPNSSMISLDVTDHPNDVTDQPNDEEVTVTDLTRFRSVSPTESIKRKRLDSVICVDDELTNFNDTTQLSPKRYKKNIDCSTPICDNNHNTIQHIIVSNFQNNDSDSSKNFNKDIVNLTKEINEESYLTIDLTYEDETLKPATVIDLDDSSCVNQTVNTCKLTNRLYSNSYAYAKDCSGTEPINKDQVKKFAKGISQLNSSEKGKLLELIVKNVLNGCQLVDKVPTKSTKKIATNPDMFPVSHYCQCPSSKSCNHTMCHLPETSKSCNHAMCHLTETPTSIKLSQATETGQDNFIKEVILGEPRSGNSIGSNIYHPSRDMRNKEGLRMVVIDGSNVAMEHTKGAYFSVKGLKICIDYFVRRGHVVKAFVPRFRCKYGKSSDPKLLNTLERQGLVVYTPSREIKGRICSSYDDRYIVQCAAEFDGVIVSGDNYKDLAKENPRWQYVIENRILPFTWVNDMIMFPKDPLGRKGPTLSEFLRHPRRLPSNNKEEQSAPR